MTQKQIKVGIVLSGCGYLDGAEIHESVMALWAIQKHGAQAVCFAPDTTQHHVINHLTGEPMSQDRNVLVEAARIARGRITALSQLQTSQIDALVLPGGFGAAKNLSSFAFDGAACIVNADLTRIVKEMAAAGKPIGAMCIAPAVIAKILGPIEVTIGSDPGTAAALEAMGATHKATTHGEIVIDPSCKIVTTPCYMLDATIDQIAQGADKLLQAILAMIEQ